LIGDLQIPENAASKEAGTGIRKTSKREGQEPDPKHSERRALPIKQDPYRLISSGKEGGKGE